MPHHIIVADADRAVNRYAVAVLARAAGEVRHLAGPWEVAGAACPDTVLVVVGGSGNGVSAAGVVRALRGRGLTTPAVVLTNGSDPEASALARDDPAVRVLVKPFSPGDLARVAGELTGGG